MSLDALDRSRGEIALTVVGNLDEVLAAAVSSIRAKVSGMVLRGMTVEEITAKLLADLESGGQIFAGLLAETDRAWASLDSGLQAANRAFRRAGPGADADPDMEWVAIVDGATCPECLVLHGMVKRLSEWIELGMPGEQDSSCNLGEVPHCRCAVVPANSVDGSVDRPVQLDGGDLTRDELLARAQSRASYNQDRVDALSNRYGVR
jgi:hypothetical protein